MTPQAAYLCCVDRCMKSWKSSNWCKRRKKQEADPPPTYIVSEQGEFASASEDGLDDPVAVEGKGAAAEGVSLDSSFPSWHI